jgi:hypothetical protein
MAANYKVLQWSLRKEEMMSDEFMKSYKIDTLRVLPGDVKQELVKTGQRREKGIAQAEKAYGIMVSQGYDGTSAMQHVPNESHSPVETTYHYKETINHALPKAVPYPQEEVILKDTNLYEALKYVRPGYFLVPSEALPAKFDNLPDGRVSSFDIYPVKQSKLTIANIARFPLSHDHPLSHMKDRLNTIWTHFLKSVHVIGQLSWRPKAQPKGYTTNWIWNNCVHLRPEVIQRALPATTRLALGPLTNGNEITWLVAPRANPVDYEFRWSARQHEQEVLMKEGKGMLPKEERRRLKKAMKVQLRIARENPQHLAVFTPRTMAVGRLTIIRKIDANLFEYEKLFEKIKKYAGSRYGNSRLMDKQEQDTVHAMINMQPVAFLKHNQPIYIPPRIGVESKRKQEWNVLQRRIARRQYIPNQTESRRGAKAPWQDGKRDAQARIKALKEGAQEGWDDDDTMNTLSTYELARPGSGCSASNQRKHAVARCDGDHEEPSPRAYISEPTSTKHEVAPSDYDDKSSSFGVHNSEQTFFASKMKPGERVEPSWKELQDGFKLFMPKRRLSDSSLLDGRSRHGSPDKDFERKSRDGQSSYQSMVEKSDIKARLETVLQIIPKG